MVVLTSELERYAPALHKKFGNALDSFHDESGYRLSIPARYELDKEGIIRAPR